MLDDFCKKIIEYENEYCNKLTKKDIPSEKYWEEIEKNYTLNDVYVTRELIEVEKELTAQFGKYVLKAGFGDGSSFFSKNFVFKLNKSLLNPGDYYPNLSSPISTYNACLGIYFDVAAVFDELKEAESIPELIYSFMCNSCTIGFSKEISKKDFIESIETLALEGRLCLFFDHLECVEYLETPIRFESMLKDYIEKRKGNTFVLIVKNPGHIDEYIREGFRILSFADTLYQELFFIIRGWDKLISQYEERECLSDGVCHKFVEYSVKTATTKLKLYYEFGSTETSFWEARIAEAEALEHLPNKELRDKAQILVEYLAWYMENNRISFVEPSQLHDIFISFYEKNKRQFKSKLVSGDLGIIGDWMISSNLAEMHLDDRGGSWGLWYSFKTSPLERFLAAEAIINRYIDEKYDYLPTYFSELIEKNNWWYSIACLMLLEGPLQEILVRSYAEYCINNEMSMRTIVAVRTLVNHITLLDMRSRYILAELFEKRKEYLEQVYFADSGSELELMKWLRIID